MRTSALIAAKRRLDPDAEQASADGKISTLRGARQVSEVNRVQKRHGVYDQTSWYPMTTIAGPGSGATAYNLGGIGEDMTLVNGPTWGTDGVQFVSASSQYGTIPDFIGSEALTVFISFIKSSTATALGIVGQWDTGNNERSWGLWQGAPPFGPLGVLTSDDGTANPSHFENRNSVLTATQKYNIAVKWENSSQTLVWNNNADVSTTPDIGSTTLAGRNNATVPITIACQLNSGTPYRFNDITTAAICIVLGDISDDARASISNVLGRL